ncbi:helix-turn-helix domain-containing protein [Micromonospora sp. CPCC 206061]|uniref:helix-turn-helix domain-containing protein n=1 Tax=Micromonospora sp. CPCC 206061 TaxID=3122410 RepID=UPI003FA5F7FC
MAGFQILPDHGLEILAEAQTVIVPGIHGGPPMTDGTIDPAVSEALRAAHDRCARIVSICTGAFAVAAAGLLDDRPATTRWLLGHRTERARTLLETTDLGVDQVARRAGFGTAAALRAQFQAALGVSPAAYRRTFRAPLS